MSELKYTMVKGQKIYSSLPEIITAFLEWNPSNFEFRIQKIKMMDGAYRYIIKQSGAFDHLILDKLKQMGFSITFEKEVL